MKAVLHAVLVWREWTGRINESGTVSCVYQGSESRRGGSFSGLVPSEGTQFSAHNPQLRLATPRNFDLPCPSHSLTRSATMSSNANGEIANAANGDAANNLSSTDGEPAASSLVAAAPLQHGTLGALPATNGNGFTEIFLFRPTHPTGIAPLAPLETSLRTSHATSL